MELCPHKPANEAYLEPDELSTYPYILFI